MIDKEILDYISLDELKLIRDKWHEIDNDVKNNAFDKYDVTYWDDAYIDRDIFTAAYTLRITTYKEENKTVMSDVILLYDEDYELGDSTIDEIESFIKTMEGSL